MHILKKDIKRKYYTKWNHIEKVLKKEFKTEVLHMK